MKKLIYIIIALIVIIIGAEYYVYLHGSKTTSPAGQTPGPTPLPPTTPDGKIGIRTSQGELLVKDITKNALQSGTYDGNSYYVIKDTQGNYEITYFSQDQGFIITLTNKDLEKTRAEAEKDFLELLGIDERQACLLKVTLNIPFNINEQAAGKNYGLSFCSNGLPLPSVQ